jgi:transcriptional regulator with XRE-family HTH domain
MTELVKARMNRGVSQKALADKVGVSWKTIARLESNEIADPGIRLLNNCALTLSVTLESLIERSWRQWKVFNEERPAPPDPGSFVSQARNREKRITRLFDNRLADGISQEELADKVGVSSKTISRLEANRIADPGIRLLNNCALALNVKLESLIEESWREWKVFNEERQAPPDPKSFFTPGRITPPKWHQDAVEAGLAISAIWPSAEPPEKMGQCP